MKGKIVTKNYECRIKRYSCASIFRTRGFSNSSIFGTISFARWICLIVVKMAAWGTDVIVSVPSINGLNRDERYVINSLMYLKRKRHSTSTESIYTV